MTLMAIMTDDTREKQSARRDTEGESEEEAQINELQGMEAMEARKKTLWP